jgi:ATP-binding cassette subfamily C protein CydD
MEGVTAAGRACEILETPLPAPGRPPAGRGPAQPDLRRDTITLHGVSLAYPGRGGPALDRVSLAIRPGERIAVTGASGAGKSSLLALLLRFAEPTAGHITTSRNESRPADITSTDVAGWRQQIAWLPQHPYLFEGTVASNIALGHPDAKPAAIARAATLAGAAEFIDALPGGYATPVGERGTRLSAGQRQRIALARAFLRDAPLLLLDEPAAHLDPITAGLILETIGRLMAGRTVVLVTHGPGGLGAGWPRGASRVLTLDHGRLVLAAGCLAAGDPGTGDSVAGVPGPGHGTRTLTATA